MSDINFLSDKGPKELDPITNLPIDDRKPSVATGITSIKDAMDQTYLDPARDDSYFSNPVHSDDPYDMQRVNWGVTDRSQIDPLRSANQHWSGKVLGGLNQAIIGEVGGGMLQGFGALGDLVFEGFEGDFENAVTRAGDKVRDFSQDITPIFQSKPGMEWNPNDVGWWSQGLVSIASTLSLMFPAMATVKGVSLVGKGLSKTGKALRTSSRVNKLGNKSLRFQIGTALQKSTRAGGKKGQALGAMTLGGTSMRYMENYREATETAIHSYDNNLGFFQDDENFDRFMKSKDGQNFLKETGTNPNDPYFKERASQWIASNAAFKSFSLNFANLAFDILQYGMVFGHLGALGKGTRASFLAPHAKKVKDAQRAMLKNPKGPTSRLGRIWEGWGSGLTKGAAWAYSEGIEEQVNWISSQEGLRYGDLMAGNMGGGNPNWGSGGFSSPRFWDRKKAYANQGGYWASTMFGAIGGATFTAGASILNRKQNQANEKRKIEEIGGRQQFIIDTLGKRQRMQEAGDLEGVAEMNRMLAINLGLNASQSGTVDLLFEMINDENFDALLLENGITKEDIQTTKKEIIDTITQAEKKYRSYNNRIFGTEYGSGAARAITELEMAMDMYSTLMSDIDTRTQEMQEGNTLAAEKANTGPNTKKRREALTQITSLQQTIEKVNSIIENLENDSSLNISEKEKNQNTASIAQFKQFLTTYKNDLKSTEQTAKELATNSKDTYTAEDLAKEEEYLAETNRNDVLSLANKKEIYKANRAMAWKQLNKILSGEFEFNIKQAPSNKIEDSLLSETKKKEKVKIDELERADIEQSWDSITRKNATDAQNDSILNDFKNILSLENTSETSINDFLTDHMDNKEVQELVKPLISQWKARKDALTLQAAIDKLRTNSENISKAVSEAKDIEDQDSIIKETKLLLNVIWGKEGTFKDGRGIPLSKKEQNAKAKDYNWLKHITSFLGRYKHGVAESLGWQWDQVFDEFTPNISVMWNDRYGVIYIKDNTLYFQDEKQHETAITQDPQTFGDIDMIVLKNTTSVPIKILGDGRTFEINGKYVSNISQPATEAIEWGKDDSLVAINLVSAEGKNVRITSPGLLIDLARNIEILEAVKIVEIQRRGMLGGVSLYAPYLVGDHTVEMSEGSNIYDTVKDKAGNKVDKRTREAKNVLRLANEALSKNAESEINKLVEKLNTANNEYSPTDNVTPSPITKETLSGTPGQSAEVSQAAEEEVNPAKSEEKINAQVNSENTVVIQPVEMTESEKKKFLDPINTAGHENDTSNTQKVLEEEKKLEKKNFEQDNNTSIDDLLREDKSNDQKIIDVVDSSINQQEPGIPTDKTSKIVTNPTATNKNKIQLDRSFPQAWTPQYKGLNVGTKENPLFVSALDIDGNHISEFENQEAGKAPYRILPQSMLSPSQLDLIDKEPPGPGTIISLHYNELRKGSDGKVIIEGTRIIVNKEKQVRFQTFNTITKKREDAVMVIYKGAVNRADIIDFDLANSDKTGVGTNVILRVEPNWQYFKSDNPATVVITVRLASDPETILSIMRGGTSSFKQNLLLRKNVTEALKGGRPMDIKAKIAGKTDGFITNIKKQGKSIKQPLSALSNAGFDIVVGYGMNGTVRTNNSDVSVSNSEYVENGTVYLAMPSASGRIIPIRTETSNLNTKAASKVIDILVSKEITDEERRAEINKIVQVYGKLEEDTQLALDNYRVKFPYSGKMIGLQIHPEGGESMSNFEKFITGEPFQYILYSNEGTIVTDGKVKNGFGVEVEKILRSSADFNSTTMINNRNTFLAYLTTRKYNIQGHEINTKEAYKSPINNQEYTDYLSYLSDPNLGILTIDIPGGRAAKFHHSIIYTEVTDDKASTLFEKATLTKKEKQDLTAVSIDKMVVEELEKEVTMSIDDLLSQIPSEKDNNKGSNKIDDINDIIGPIKLREVDTVSEPTYNLVTDEEIGWFNEKFGKEGLNVLERAKWIRVSKGRNAWGFYVNGLATVAKEGKEGTVYWEAFRRVFDIHLSENEKAAIINEVKVDKMTDEQAETALAGKFMEYMIDENNPSFTGKIKKFFKELLYSIKNFLGLNTSIDRIFRNIKDTQYKNYTAEKLNSLSKVENVKLRQMFNSEGIAMPQEFVEEIVGNINYDLYSALQAKSKEENKSFESYLSDSKTLEGFYENLRQQYKAIGEKILATENISDRVRSIGQNYVRITEDSLWGIRTDALHNLTSPGFKKLAIQNLQPLFGVKYTTFRGETIESENKIEISDDLQANEMNDIARETEPQAQERIHGINFYYRPVKDTLSKSVKIGLSFIESKEKGNLLGKHRFVPFNDVYNYLALNLSNTPEGRILEKLKTLKHELVDQVLEKYTEASPSWQNKFVTHFHKQNIAFKTLVLENNGAVKVMYTNRNGLERQLINDWKNNRYNSEIFTEVLGKEDDIDVSAAKKIATILNTDLVKIANKFQNINSIKEQKEGKKAYMVPMMRVLSSLGIILPQNMKTDLFSDESVTVADLHSYMFGSNSFQYIFQNLTKENPISPYMANNMEMGALGKLSKLVYQYKIDSYLASFIGGNRKNIYSINLNTYDSERTLALRSDETFNATINKYFKDVFYKPNSRNAHIILDILLKNPDVRSNFQLSSFDVVKEKGNYGRATAYDRMTENLSALTRFSMFNNSGSKYAEFNTGTKSDKGQFKFITFPKITKQNKGLGLWKSTELGTKGYIDTAVALLRPLVLSEYARISKVERQLFDVKIDLNKQIKNVHYRNEPGDMDANGLKFMIFRDLNKKEWGLFNSQGRLNHVYNGNEANLDAFNSISANIDGFLRQYITNQIYSTIETFVEAKAITRVGNEVHNINLPVQALQGKSIGKDITFALVEFAVNDIVMKPYIGTMFGPDLAFYSSNEMGNVMVDAGKRAYQSITPGINVTYNEEHDYGVKPKFRHAVLKDVVKISPETEERFKNILLNVGVEAGKAAKIASNYRETLKTDAQGYTTLEFHKRMMESQGMWLKEHDNAYNTYWKKGLLGKKEEQALLVDPLKTYYYGDILEDDGHGNETLVFKQIKHSTIPLLKAYTQLFKEDNEVSLDTLRERMEGTGKFKNLDPIDMVNFESGVKVGLSGVSNNSSLDKINVEILESKYIRSPQVITTKTKDPLFGSQFSKLLPSNILEKNNYSVYGSKLTGGEVKDLYNDLWAEKIQRSSDKLAKKIGWREFRDLMIKKDGLTDKQFSDGQLKFLKKIKNEMYQTLQERELPDNYFLALDIEELTNDVNKYDFSTPLAFPTFAKRFENILLSLYKNNILKQRSKGMAAVQIADYGWSKNKELQIKTNKNGGIYAEVALPYEMAMKMGLAVGDVTNLEDPMLEAIGYRIPTQGKNSMMALKVVRILPPNMGAVIQLPAEITTIMGSDYDIDKMYLMFPEKTKEGKRESAFKFDNYQTKKSFSGLSDQAVNQAIFDLAHSILASKHSVEEILTPLDSNTYQEAIESYQEAGLIKNINDLDVFTPAADMYLEKINKDAAMLIGLFSINSTSHGVAQEMDITFNGNAKVFFGGLEVSTLSNTFDIDGNLISDAIKDDQNESLDNAKNQRLGPAGVSVYNHGVKMLLNRSGVPARASLDFINQPLLREYQKERATSSNNISDIKLAEQVVERWGVKEEFLNAKKMFGEDRYFTPTKSSLKASLVHRKDGTREHKVQQAQLLADFMHYLDIARDMGKLNQVLNPEGLKNFSRLSYLEVFKNAQDYLESTSSHIKIGKMPKRTEAFIKYGIDEAIEMTSHFIPFNKEGFLELKRKIAQYTGQRDNMLSQELTETINSLGLYYSFTQPSSPLAPIFYNKEGKADMSLIQKRLFTLSESTVNKFLTLRASKNLQNDKFFGMLFAHGENTGKNKYIKILAFNNTTKLDSAQKSAITDRWEQLLDPNITKDVEVRRMAEALVLYSIVTSGFISTGPNSFVDLVPNSYWSNKDENKDSLSNFYRKEVRTMAYSNYFDDNAARQIIRNAFKDPGLLSTIDKKSLTHNNIVKNFGLNKNNYFIHKDASNDILTKIGQAEQYAEYFKVFDSKWRLFQLNRKLDTGAIYQEIEPLGERYKFVEMVSRDALPTSIHPGNSTKFKQSLDSSLSNVPPPNSENTESVDELLGSARIKPSGSLQNKIEDLDNRLLTYLNKEFGITSRSYDVLKLKTGQDALGVADILHKIIHLSNNRDIYTVPEETAHFFIDMLQDKALVKRIMTLASKTALHGEVLRDYEGVYNTAEEFQKETAGKILGQYIVNKDVSGAHYYSDVYGDRFAKDYSGFIGLLNKLWDRIKSIFTGTSGTTALNREIRNVFGPKADQILSGNALGLDVNLLRENTQAKYYSIGSKMKDASTVMGNTGEAILNKIGKSLSTLDFSKQELKELGEKGKTLIKRMSSWKQSDYISELIADSNRITEPLGNEDYYTKDGIKLTRVTGIQDYFSDAFAEEAMAVKVAKANRAKGDVFNSAERVLNLWQFLQEGGTAIHSTMEGIISGKNNTDIIDSLNTDPKSKKAIQKALPILQTWVKAKQNQGSKLYAEVKIADMNNLVAGTIDVIEQTSSGRIFLHDFKSKVAGKLIEIEKKLPSFKYALSSVPNTVLNQYRIQLSLYKYILEQKGIKVDGISIQPLEATVNITPETGIVNFETIKFPSSTSQITNKLANLKPIDNSIIKNMLKKVNPESEGVTEDIQEKDAALRVLSRAKEVILTKIDRYKKTGNVEYLESMQELSKQLDEVSEKEGIILFTKKALIEINGAHKRLLQLQKDDAINARNLSEINNYVSAYEILDEMTLLAPSLGKTGYEAIIQKYVAPAILKRQQVGELYKALGRPLIADFLSRYSTKPGMTKQKLEGELIKASRDISYMARWINALADSKLTELAMIDKNVSIQNNIVQEAKYNLEYGADKSEGLFDILKEFEDHRAAQGSKVTNYVDLFEPMLEMHNGKPTGFMIGPTSFEFRKKRNDFIKEKEDAGEAITSRLWNEFFESNEFVEDPKYMALMKLPDTNPTKKFYDFFIENYKYAQSILPGFSRRGLMLPGLRKTPQEKFMEQEGFVSGTIKGTWDALKESALQAGTITEDEIEYKERVDEKGDSMHYVPIHYSHKIGLEEGMMNPEDVSYDLGSALSMYYTMAVNNQQMNEILAELELTKELLKHRKVVKNKSGMPVINPVTGGQVTTEGVQSNAYNRVVDYLNMQVYGERKKKGAEIMNIAGKKVSADKVLDNFLSYNSLRVLALNPHAGFANVAFGNLLNSIESYAGQYFGVKNFIRAKTEYYGNLSGTIKDVIGRSPTSKIGLMNEYFNVLQHFDEYGNRIKHNSLALRGINTGAFFFMMTMGEHMIQSQLFMAMAMQKKFKLADNSEISLWDSYKVENNKLILKPEIAEQFTQQDRAIFKERVQGAYQKLHGIYNSKDRNAIQQYAAGRWVMQFRKWMPSGFQRRFEGIEKLWYDKNSEFKGAEWNERLESYVEGNYISMLRFMNQVKYDVAKMKIYTVKEKWNELDLWQQQNVKRSLGEIASFFTLIALSSLMKTDDDKDKGYVYWQTLYTINRVKQELLFFTYLPETFNILKTPAASLTSIEALMAAVGQILSDTGSLMTGGDLDRYERRTGKWEKGDPKLYKKLYNVLPFRQLLQPAKDKLTWFHLN